MKIKKLVYIILYTAISIFLFYVLNLLFMPKYINENNDGRITAEFYREKLNDDVIFVGSSTVQAGISPAVLWEKYGIASYDRSNSSQTVPLSYYMVKDALRKCRPSLVVLDVGFLLQAEDFYEEPSLRKALDYMQPSIVKLDCIKACENEITYKKLLEYAFPVFRYHARWNDLNTDDWKYLFCKPDVTYNGQLIDFEGQMYDDFEIVDVADESLAICDYNLNYLQMLYDLCKENDIDLLLVKLPRIYQAYSDTANAQIMDFAEKNNIIYKDFQDEVSVINAGNAGFSDHQHMNTYGAERFTIILGDFILSNYDVPVRNSDNKYINEWSKKSARYRDALAGAADN